MRLIEFWSPIELLKTLLEHAQLLKLSHPAPILSKKWPQEFLRPLLFFELGSDQIGFKLPEQVLNSEGEEDVGHEVDDLFLWLKSQDQRVSRFDQNS